MAPYRFQRRKARQKADVLFEGETIRQVGPALDPSGHTVVDAKGLYWSCPAASTCTPISICPSGEPSRPTTIVPVPSPPLLAAPPR